MIFVGDAALLREKLLSIADHLSNKHEFPENSLYKACAHGEVVASAEKPWLDEDSLVQQFMEKKSFNHFKL
jgi:hypothetical protein